jgi:hypothetical protein
MNQHVELPVNPDIDYLRAFGTHPRVHGNGFIQIDLPGDRRAHFWGHHAIPRQSSATPIHDHRFDFSSRVLRGSIVNVTYYETWGEGRDFEIYTPVFRQGEDTKLEPTGRQIRVEPVRVQMFTPEMTANSYFSVAGVFHETMVNEPTATLITKGQTYQITPRVLVPLGKQPDNEFTRYDVSESDIWAIVEDILK